MKQFEFEEKTLKGRVVNATYSPAVNTTFCTVDTGAERFWVESHGDLSEGDWKPFLVRKAEK